MSRDARLDALDGLYSSDATGEAPSESAMGARAYRLASGAWEQRAELDEELAAVATGWRVERMPAVDRAVLRLALFELRHTETPIGVVISEAVEMAKNYSTARSGAFVNGVLAKLAGPAEAPVGEPST